MTNGFENEHLFVEKFNQKYLCEFDLNSKKFLLELFNGNISDDEKIICWKNKINQKADFFIKYKTLVRGVSLKCGHDNSVHHEQFQDFKLFLEELNISYKIIEYYVSYHFGYDRFDNGKNDFSKSLSAKEYKAKYQNEINCFNKEINHSKMIIEMIDRFIIYGRNSKYGIDALISGTVDNYVWIMKNDIYDLIFEKRYNDYTSPHIACLIIGPKKRNLNRDSKNSRDRYVVRVRWDTIKEDIIDFKRK